MSCPRLPIVGGIAHAAGEEDEFVGIDRWKDTIFGIAADHAESVDEHPDEEIGLTESFTVLPRHNATIDEGSQRLHGVGGAQDRKSMTMRDLEILDCIFDIDNPSVAMFEVYRASLHELLQLLPAQVEGNTKIPRFTAVDITITMGFDSLTQGRIARHMPQFNQWLAFERGGKTVVTIVARDLVERIRQRTFPPVGPEAYVQMKDPLLLGLDPL